MSDPQQKNKKNSLAARFGFYGIKKRWFLNNISVVLLAMFLIVAVAAVSLTYYYYASVETTLETRANTTSKFLNRYFTSSFSEFYENSRRMVEDFSMADRLEMQVLDSSGKVMFSSTGLTAGTVPSTGEVETSFSYGESETFNGYDVTTNEKVMSVTAPVYYQNGRLIGGIRYVTSLKLLDAQLTKIYLVLLGFLLLIATTIIISNSFFLRSIVNPVLKINELAKKITGGQYGARLNIEYSDEIGELCETLNNMSAELARMDKVKNDFISSVSHELRTPLTAINGWTETIAADSTDKELAAAGLKIIQKETRRLSQMVEELLDFSRIESGALKLQSERFDLRGDLYDAVFTYMDMLRQEGLRVEYEEPEEPLFVFGDRNRLKQVFLNIIDNAGKYGKDGDHVLVTANAVTDNCVIHIRDFGQGIPPDELPFVKEKFFKGSARGRGAGIGLSVCNEIITMHGGSLNIESTVGQGTDVIITLPLDKPAEQNTTGEAAV